MNGTNATKDLLIDYKKILIISLKESFFKSATVQNKVNSSF